MQNVQGTPIASSVALTERQKHALCIEALAVKTNIEWRFIELGKLLHEIKEGRLYEAGWESWDEYCMEFKLSQATISKLINIYEVFVLGYQFQPKQLAEAGGWSTVAELLPVISPETTPRKRVQELLGIATTQTRTDLRKTVHAAKKGMECKHKSTRIVVVKFEVCNDCPERHRLYE